MPPTKPELPSIGGLFVLDNLPRVGSPKKTNRILLFGLLDDYLGYTWDKVTIQRYKPVSRHFLDGMPIL